MKHNPHIISCSMGYDLCPSDPNTGQRTSNAPLSKLPNNLVALEAEIQAAVASGVVIVFSAGNGSVSFPGMMPEVISAGGAFVDQNGDTRASDYASAFTSRVYSGRNVPDFRGLVGLRPNADFIMLPIPPGCEIDKENSPHDQTTGKIAFHSTGDACSTRSTTSQNEVTDAMVAGYHAPLPADRPAFFFHLGDLVYNIAEAFQFYEPSQDL